MVRAASELNLKTKMFGGGMVGLQATIFKTQLGPQLNGIVNYRPWLPVGSLATSEALELLKKYQARAAKAWIRLATTWLRSATPRFNCSVKRSKQPRASTKARSPNTFRNTEHKTAIGTFKFAADGEWTQSRVLLVQFHNIKSNAVDQFRDMATQAVIAPADLKTGKLIYPYTDARN